MNKINCYFLGTSILKFMLQPLWICILKPINQFSPVQKHNLSFGSLMGHANHLKWKRKCLAWKAVCYAMHYYIWMWGVYKLAWPKENIKGRDSLMRKMHYLTPGLTELAFSAARVLRLDQCFLANGGKLLSTVWVIGNQNTRMRRIYQAYFNMRRKMCFWWCWDGWKGKPAAAAN